jgi:hypothetical protein
MASRVEQYCSLLEARDILREILVCPNPRMLGVLQDRASRALKNFPPLNHLGRPLFEEGECEVNI